MSQSYFAVTSPGLEPFLQEELRALGARKVTLLDGGAEFDATRKVFYRVLQHSRIANRVTMRLATFKARAFPDLFKRTRKQPWAQWLPPGASVDVRASARQSRLIHSGRIAETVMDALSEHPTGDGPGQRIYVRIDEDIATLSLDAAGEELHFRGWRKSPVEAPLRENLAAAALRAMKWTPDEMLIDPTCGSGTILIEAALMASGRPTRLDYAAKNWANLDADAWKEVENEAASELAGLWGYDISPKAIEATLANAATADVTLNASQADVADLKPTGPCGLILCNPPYGLRLSDTSATKALLSIFAQRFEGWRLGFIMPSEFHPSHRKLDFVRVAQFLNGGLRVNLWSATHR